MIPYKVVDSVDGKVVKKSVVDYDHIVIVTEDNCIMYVECVSDYDCVDVRCRTKLTKEEEKRFGFITKDEYNEYISAKRSKTDEILKKDRRDQYEKLKKEFENESNQVQAKQ